MALTETQVANMALGRLGAAQLTDLDTDSSTEATQCNLYLDTTRDALLRSHAWRFASQAAELVQDEETDSGTSTGTNSTTTLNDTGKSWSVNAYAGYYLWITGGTGADQVRVIASNTATKLTMSAANAFTITPDATSTYEVWATYPPYPWDYQYDLPSNFLRFAKTYPLHELFEIDGVMLKTDQTAVTINYIKQVTNPDDFDPLFVDALVAALAAKLCMPLLRDKVWTRELQDEAERALARARLTNLQEAKIRPTEPTWNEARSL